MTAARGAWSGVLGIAAAGLVLVAAPWLVRRAAPMPLAVELPPEAGAPPLALATIDAVDRACRGGDVAAFRGWATSAFVDGLEEKLRWLGRRLDPAGLLAAGGPDGVGGLGAELAARPFLGGACAGGRAVLLYDLADVAGDAGYPVRPGCKAVVLEWDGARLRLHQVHEQTLPPGADPAAARAELTRRLLAGSAR